MKSWRPTSPPLLQNPAPQVTCKYFSQPGVSFTENLLEKLDFVLRTVRKEFINAKYVDHKYAKKTCTSAAAKMIELFEAIQTRDLLALIQVYAEGVELMEPLPETGQVSGTAASPLSVSGEFCWYMMPNFSAQPCFNFSFHFAFLNPRSN